MWGLLRGLWGHLWGVCDLLDGYLGLVLGEGVVAERRGLVCRVSVMLQGPIPAPHVSLMPGSDTECEGLLASVGPVWPVYASLLVCCKGWGLPVSIPPPNPSLIAIGNAVWMGGCQGGC